MTVFDLVIVGAGPAGAAAAVTVADHGLSVALVDEQQRIGGQIFRQPPRAFTDSKMKFPAGYDWGHSLLTDAEARGDIIWLPGTTALGVLRDREKDDEDMRVAVNGPEGGRTLKTRRLLIATGAYDMPVAFPGWTLPGVFMAGGVQTLLKSQKFLVSKRLVLAGSHPLLIVVADLLHRSGANIAEIAFARKLPGLKELVRSVGVVPGHVGMLAELAASITRLARAGVRFSTGTMISGALGDQHVERVELTKVDDDWRPIGGSREVDTPTLVLGYGFLPSTELARQVGCSLSWDSPKGGWIVDHDEHMQTTVAGIYAAGEPTGVAGADQSRAEGMLAGLAIIEELRGTVVDAKFSAARRDLRKAQRFSQIVQRVFAPNRKGLEHLTTADTTICRCELVTRGRLAATLDANPHLSTSNAAKLECRSGMGPCQGRYCESAVSQVVASSRGRSLEQVGRFSAHFPIKPVPLKVLTQIDD